MYIHDTIAAIATPLGEGGIGIVRLSGEGAKEIVISFFKPRYAEFPLQSHHLYYGHIVDPVSGEKIDEVLVSLMLAPHTYTREDVLEINCHGGIVPLKKVLDLVLANGVRLAEPGEFTKRAFLNGRLDLAQAEGLLQVIRAKTEEGLKAAVDQLSGSLSSEVNEMRQQILFLLAPLEATIDFPEEEITALSRETVKVKVKELSDKALALLEEAEKGKIYREGVETAIIGRPNVGKSSLLNALLREERAIVTEVPGTTRDLLEEYINIKGIPLKIIDSAGIRKTKNRVEIIGVNRARSLVERADLILFMLDAAEDLQEEDREIVSLLQGKKVIVLLNKTDLRQQLTVEKIKKLLGATKIISTSLIRGEGLTELEEAICELILSGTVEAERVSFLAGARQKQALRKAKDFLEEAWRNNLNDLDLLSLDLQAARTALGEITGETVGEDILDTIFAEFCIGK